MDQSQADITPTNCDRSADHFNWHFIRKIETLVFASLLLAVPFFVCRIVDTAASALMVQNTAVALVKDLIRAREIAKGYNLPITVVTIPKCGKQPYLYLIRNGESTIEQIALPKGVAAVGTVMFDDKGVPRQCASFVVSKGTRTACVEVDAQGQTSLH